MATELEALARVIQSEVGSSGSLAERIAIGWVARNRARKRKQTIAQMAMPPAKQGKGRPFSSARSATAESTDAATQVLAMPASADPTNGATSAFEPALQDELFSRGRKGYSQDAGMVRAKWLRELGYYGSVGGWDLFGPKGGPGERPVPAEWGIARKAIRGPVSRVNVTRPARSGGFLWLFPLLFVLVSKRR